jgi:integrase/recombinase XerD
MSNFSDACEQYLQVRRALGFKLHDHGNMLADFVAYLDRAEASTLTTELALAWATQSVGVQPYRHRVRLSIVRGFARYLHALDPAHEVPASGLLAYRPRYSLPRQYSDEQITALIAAAGSLDVPLRAASYSTLFGLLAVTGLRVGEALRLDRDDVELDRGLLVVRNTKFGKSRTLPLAASTVQALECYRLKRDHLCPQPTDPAFLLTTTGTRIIYSSARRMFIRLAGEVGLEPRAGNTHARIHDLRHSWAIATLLDFYRQGHQGLDVSARIPLLSGYLGHSGPQSSWWYLHATPELLWLACERLESALGELG